MKTIPCDKCRGTGKRLDPIATGREMRAMRELAGKTQEEVAARLVYSTLYIADLEHGRRNWTPELRARYIAALGK